MNAAADASREDKQAASEERLRHEPGDSENGHLGDEEDAVTRSNKLPSDVASTLAMPSRPHSVAVTDITIKGRRREVDPRNSHQRVDHKGEADVDLALGVSDILLNTAGLEAGIDAKNAFKSYVTRAELNAAQEEEDGPIASGTEDESFENKNDTVDAKTAVSTDADALLSVQQLECNNVRKRRMKNEDHDAAKGETWVSETSGAPTPSIAPHDELEHAKNRQLREVPGEPQVEPINDRYDVDGPAPRAGGWCYDTDLLRIFGTQLPQILYWCFLYTPEMLQSWVFLTGFSSEVLNLGLRVWLRCALLRLRGNRTDEFLGSQPTRRLSWLVFLLDFLGIVTFIMTVTTIKESECGFAIVASLRGVGFLLGLWDFCEKPGLPTLSATG
mmetsp:Transcript_10289/g.38963  ORF Transcript_10289/g.38963 Transcript_10289/m.38963 type:complete len:387 (-) Transcript_10289:300-1460(-)|eukprot:scaffold308_cov176-Pinguiococcus_pyrenoidosus.AAC.3